MNTRDLIELSQLDALGLLDEQEREEFDTAFAGASPAIKAQIRAEQARLVKTDWVPCQAEPPEGLREAVLDEMSMTMRVADLRPRVLGAVHEEISRRALVRETVAHGAGRVVPRVYPVRRVSKLWRAAALGFASAAVAFAGTTLHLKGMFDQIAVQQQSGMFGAGLPLRDFMFDRSLKQVFFTPGEGVKGNATLYVNKDGGGRLVIRDLASKPGHQYRVVALSEQGEIGEELTQFTSDGRMEGVGVTINPAKHSRVAIVETTLGQEAEKGTVLLTSDRLA